MSVTATSHQRAVAITCLDFCGAFTSSIFKRSQTSRWTVRTSDSAVRPLSSIEVKMLGASVTVSLLPDQLHQCGLLFGAGG